MPTIKVMAGSWPKQTARVSGDGFALRKPTGLWDLEHFRLGDLRRPELATEESVKKLGGTLGWGATGAVLLGPVGLLAGALVGGRKTEVTFVAQLNGEAFMGQTDKKTWQKILASNL